MGRGTIDNHFLLFVIVTFGKIREGITSKVERWSEILKFIEFRISRTMMEDIKCNLKNIVRRN